MVIPASPGALASDKINKGTAFQDDSFYSLGTVAGTLVLGRRIELLLQD